MIRKPPAEVAIVSVEESSPIGMNLWISPEGEAIVHLRGDLDMGSAETAFDFVGDFVDRGHGPVVVDLSGVRFCDSHGLRALIRMRDYAERSGSALQLAAPSESLLKVMRISGLKLKFHAF